MTGRTHDLAAFAAVSWVFLNTGLPAMSLGTLVVAGGASFLGGLFPDLDNASSDFWDKIPGGSLWGKLLAPLTGGHRMISHSLVGLVISGFLLFKLLKLMSSVLVVDMNTVWWSFMIGMVSHLMADSLTKEGIPLFFPIPIKVGFPPFKFMRIETGKRLEKYLIYPVLMLMVGYMYMSNYKEVLDFLQNKLY